MVHSPLDDHMYVLDTELAGTTLHYETTFRMLARIIDTPSSLAHSLATVSGWCRSETGISGGV